MAEESIFVRRAKFQQPRRISRLPYISLSRLIFSESPSPSSPTPPDVLNDSSLIGHFPPHLLDSRALENQLFLNIIRPCVIYQVFIHMREDFTLSLFAYLDIFTLLRPNVFLKDKHNKMFKQCSYKQNALKIIVLGMLVTRII